MVINADPGVDIRQVLGDKYCTYCGIPSDLQRDHVIPTSYLRIKRRYAGDWLVPACGECNRMLGSHLIFNVPDRAAWVMVAYQHKYRKVLTTVLWDDDELDEMSPRMRKNIKARLKARAEMERRLDHLKVVAAMPLTYMAHLRPAIDPEDEEFAEFIVDDNQRAEERRRELLARARKYFGKASR